MINMQKIYWRRASEPMFVGRKGSRAGQRERLSCEAVSVIVSADSAGALRLE